MALAGDGGPMTKPRLETNEACRREGRHCSEFFATLGADKLEIDVAPGAKVI